MTSGITHNVPPQGFIDLVNPLVRLTLRSPLHAVLDPALITLHVRGRRTGRRYDIPVGYVGMDDRLVVVTQHRWRANLRGGSDVGVTHQGRCTPMHAELDEVPASVARTLFEVIDRIGWKAARPQLGLVIESRRTPTVPELQEAVRECGLAVITLTAPAPGSDDDMPGREETTS